MSSAILLGAAGREGVHGPQFVFHIPWDLGCLRKTFCCTKNAVEVSRQIVTA